MAVAYRDCLCCGVALDPGTGIEYCDRCNIDACIGLDGEPDHAVPDRRRFTIELSRGEYLALASAVALGAYDLLEQGRPEGTLTSGWTQILNGWESTK